MEDRRCSDPGPFLQGIGSRTWLRQLARSRPWKCRSRRPWVVNQSLARAQAAPRLYSVKSYILGGGRGLVSRVQVQARGALLSRRCLHERAGRSRCADIQADLRDVSLDRGARRQSAREVGKRHGSRSLHDHFDDDAAEQSWQPASGGIREHRRLLPAAERARAWLDGAAGRSRGVRRYAHRSSLTVGVRMPVSEMS